jgi:Fe-S cluster assembly scaffold protein SufB
MIAKPFVFNKALEDQLLALVTREPRLGLAQEAVQRLQKRGLLRGKEEGWKYTTLTELARTKLTQTEKAELIVDAPTEVRVRRGAAYSEDSFLIKQLRSRLPKADGLELVSLAAQRGVVEITIPDQTVVSRPILIQLPLGAAQSLSAPLVVVLVGKGSRVTLIETTRTLDGAVSLPMVYGLAQANSQASHYQFLGSTESVLRTKTNWSVSDHAVLNVTSVAHSGKLVRCDMTVELMGRSARADVRGLMVVGAKQNLDCQVDIHHKNSETTSSQEYRAIVSPGGKGVFNGVTIVPAGLKKIKAFQKTKNILLDVSASMNAKPELRIESDDVECTHGATISQLSAQSLMYLRARGLDQSQAQRLLLQAFRREVLDSIQDVPTRVRAQEFTEVA